MTSCKLVSTGYSGYSEGKGLDALPNHKAEKIMFEVVLHCGHCRDAIKMVCPLKFG